MANDKLKSQDFDKNPEWLEHCRRVEEVIETATTYDDVGDIVWLSVSREEWTELGLTLGRLVSKWLDASRREVEKARVTD